MRFVDTPLQDAFLMQLEPKTDQRGSFCRLFCSKLLEEKGIHTSFVQVNLSENTHAKTLRGLHYQKEPYLEAKIVYCLQGEVYDVLLDLREESPTYLHHFGVILSSTSPSALYIPKGFAHGFLSLKPHSHLLYLMSEFYQAGYEGGYRYDDPAFGIKWPFPPEVLSERDQSYPPFHSLAGVL